MKRVGNLLAAFAVVCGAAAASDALAQHRGHGDAAPAAVVATPEARRADIESFRTQFLARDRSYSDAARAEAEARLAQLDARADSISQAYFELEIARIVALADNGHTTSFAGPRSRRYDRAQIRLAPFGDDFYVLRARSEDADLLGARLTAIDGHPIAEVRAVARTLEGGTDGRRDRNADLFFESPEQMHALGVIAQADRATYRFALRNGGEVDRRLTVEPADSNRLRGNSDRWFYPAPVEGEDSNWRSALAPEAAPWALQEPDNPFRWRVAPEIDGIVIELRQNNDSGDRTIASALAEFRAAIASAHPRNLVLDMRMNGGGNLQTTRDFMKSLPHIVSGRIFVLTSPWTFSAAISSIGYVKQEAPDRVSIVGENVGDRLNFFSEGDVVTLPNSQAIMLYATQRHDYVTGCRPFRDCHGPVRQYPIALPTLAPDIPAPWTIDGWLAGRDPAMDAVAQALR